MKNESFIKIAEENLLKIRNSDSQSLNYNEFIHDDENGVDLSDLVAFLEKNSFIETDLDPEVFFLTSETYDILDERDVFTEISVLFDSEYEEDYDDESNFEYNDTKPERSDEELKQLVAKNKAERIHLKVASYITFILILIIVGFISYYLKSSKVSNGLDEHLLKDIKIQLDKIDIRDYKK